MPALKPAIAFLLLLFCHDFAEAQKNFARQGILDLRNWDFNSSGHADLDGEWEFHMARLVRPAELTRMANTVVDYTYFPSSWNAASGAQSPGDGFATYRLRVILSDTQPLAFELPHFYSNYAMWINAKPVASNGRVGESIETSLPQWLPQTVTYQPDNDTLDIVIHASNFHHAIGGVRDKIRIGTPSQLLSKRELSVTGTGILCGALVVIAFSFVAVYFFRNERSALYFAALCITWGCREAFSNLYIVTAAYPDFPWEITVRIEYIALYLTMAWATLFLSRMFPHDSSNIFKYLFLASNLVFTIFTLIVDASVFTQFLPVYLSFASVLLLYTIYVLVRAVVYERQSVWLLVSSTMLGVIVFGYDIIAYEGFATYNSVIINIAYLSIFVMIAIALAIKYGFIASKSGQSDLLTYDELYGTRK